MHAILAFVCGHPMLRAGFHVFDHVFDAWIDLFSRWSYWDCLDKWIFKKWTSAGIF